MSRGTTIWQELGIGVLTGATIILASAIWLLVAGTAERRAPLSPSSSSEQTVPTFGPRLG